MKNQICWLDDRTCKSKKILRRKTFIPNDLTICDKCIRRKKR